MSDSLTRSSRVFLLGTLLLDMLLVNASFVTTSLVRFGVLYPTDAFLPIYVKLQLSLNLAVPLALVLTGAYRDPYRASLGHQAITSFKACVWVSLITAAVLYLQHNLGYSRIFVTAHLLQITLLLPFARVLLGRVAEAARARGHGVRPVVLAGEREPLAEAALHLRLASHLGYRIVGIQPLGWQPAADEVRQLAVLDGPEQLSAYLERHRVRRVFVCDRVVQRERYKAIVEAAAQVGADVRLIVSPVLIPDHRARIHDVLAVPLTLGTAKPSRASHSRLKRGLDVLLSGGLLLLSAPLFALIAAAVKLSSPGPVFYRQTRLGMGGRRFELFKFRSMVADADTGRHQLEQANEASGPLFKIKRDPRITSVGRWLRWLSLDELPQLWNVLRGDMSLVGPRPPLPQEAERYEPWQRLRLEVPQGLTGLWQVSGRSRLSFDEMVLLDLYYGENWSFLLDLEIMIETVPTMLHGDGAF